jgi:hypothetical protein
MQYYPLKGAPQLLLYKRTRLRIKILSVKLKKLLISDYKQAERSYERKKGVKPDLKNPKTYSEKLLYLKLHYRNPLQTLCADKYYVAEYVRACGYEYILKKNYAVYNDARDIDFKLLPDKFFMRCNHLSGFNYLVDKNTIDQTHTKKLFSILLKENYYAGGREWPYKNIKPRVICEEILANKDGTPLVDYKFYCFSGEPKYFMVSLGEYEHEVKNHKFDMQFNSIDKFFKKKPAIDASDIKLPDNIDEMVAIVKKLCKPFPHVRVDLYNIDGRIVFGELTFFSSGGIVNVDSSEYDAKIASWIDLNRYKNDMV